MKTPNLPFLTNRIQFSEVVFSFLFFLWTKDLIKNKKLPQDPGLNKQYLLFLIFCLLSFFHSSNLFISVIELLGLIYLYVMLILVVDIVDNKRKLDTVIKVWIGTSAVVLTLGFVGWCISIVSGKGNFFSYGLYETFPYFKTVYRAISTFRYAQGLGNYLVVSLGFVISDLLLTQNNRYKVFLKIMIFFICLTIFATVSMSILGFALSSFLIYNHFHKVKDLRFKIIRFLSISSIIVIFLLTTFCSIFYIRSFKIEKYSKETHKELVVNIDYVYDSRLALKIAAFEMIKRHPFLGVGLAIYPSYTQKLKDENYFYLKNFTPIYLYTRAYAGGNPYVNYLPVIDPHNDVLQYMAETGIFGGGAFVLLIAAFIYAAFRNLKNVESQNQYLRVRLFCFLASFIGALTDTIASDIFKIRHLWFLMALILSIIIHKKKIVKSEVFLETKS